MERSHSGLVRRLGKAVYRKVSRVQIPLSPHANQGKFSWDRGVLLTYTWHSSNLTIQFQRFLLRTELTSKKVGATPLLLVTIQECSHPSKAQENSCVLAGASSNPHVYSPISFGSMPNTIVRTGGKAPTSGQYRPSGSEREITLVKGKTVPPNNDGVRQIFTLVDKTKHKR